MAGEALRDDHEQYRLLMDNVKDYAIFLIDLKGNIATWNVGAERTLGYKEAEVIGQPFSLIFTTIDNQNHQPERELATAKEKGRAEDERWHVRKDGSQFWASGVVTPLWDEGGKLRGYAKVMRDITERKLHEQQLGEANHRKDEFLAMLAHELRNPLAPIMNTLHVMRQDRTASPTQQQAASVIERQVRQIGRLVDDLLDVSRFTRGKIQLHKERVRLNDIVTHAVETTRPLINSRKHQLSVSLPAEAVWLEADPARVEQILINLLNNAAKYTEPGGQIWLSVEREGSQVVLKVKDSGIGILAEMLPKVFDLFIQADRSLDRAQGGLGIGLTLVRSLVHLHGGTIEAKSEGVGKGSEFTARLAAVAEVAELKPEAVAEAEVKEIRRLKLLVVDDNIDTAESLAMLLRLYGHEVKVAHTGPTALQAARLHKPDMVLLDIGLPGMDGFQVARHLRETGFAMVPLIAMTGYGQEGDRERSKEAGFDYHLVKPVDPVKLQALLGRLAGLQEGQRSSAGDTAP